MAETKKERSGLGYAAQLTLGVGFFVVGSVVSVTKQTVRAVSKAARSARPTPAKKKEAKDAAESPAAKALPLKLKASPRTFTRGQAGTIIAETLPGASCTFEAVYSTNRRPTGLDPEPAIAGYDGVLEWTWVIGTGGDYVDVTVTASLVGHEETTAEKRVTISD